MTRWDCWATFFKDILRSKTRLFQFLLNLGGGHQQGPGVVMVLFWKHVCELVSLFKGHSDHSKPKIPEPKNTIIKRERNLWVIFSTQTSPLKKTADSSPTRIGWIFQPKNHQFQIIASLFSLGQWRSLYPQDVVDIWEGRLDAVEFVHFGGRGGSGVVVENVWRPCLSKGYPKHTGEWNSHEIRHQKP